MNLHTQLQQRAAQGRPIRVGLIGAGKFGTNGLLYPPASVEDIPFVTRPISEGGVLEKKGMVEVISSLEADGRKIPYDIRMGVWVTVEGETA